MFQLWASGFFLPLLYIEHMSLKFFIFILQMIIEAITCLKERTGSSHYSIASTSAKSTSCNSLPISITIQLKNIARSRKLTKVKNSFKLSEELKKSVKPKIAKPMKPKSLANKLASKPKATFGLKKVQKHALS